MAEMSLPSEMEEPADPTFDERVEEAREAGVDEDIIEDLQDMRETLLEMDEDPSTAKEVLEIKINTQKILTSPSR